jgi:hypothetical protein
MSRLAMAVVLMMAVGSVGIGSAAVGSVAMAQQNQFPGVAPPVPSPAPPAIAPGPAAPQSMQQRSPARAPDLVQRRRGPPVAVPRGENDSFPDRATNCVHYGTAAGVQPGEIGQFTRNCVNN